MDKGTMARQSVGMWTGSRECQADSYQSTTPTTTSTTESHFVLAIGFRSQARIVGTGMRGVVSRLRGVLSAWYHND